MGSEGKYLEAKSMDPVLAADESRGLLEEAQLN